MRAALQGINDTGTLLAFRFKSAKKRYKALIVGILLFVIGCVYSATRLNKTLFFLLSTPTPDTPTADSFDTVKRYIAIYLSLYQDKDLDLFITLAVVFLLGSMLFVPFSGYVVHGVISANELTTVKNGDAYKIGDSIVYQMVSSYTFIQLVGITVVMQLLTVDRPNSGMAVVFGWVVWLALTLATTLLSWGTEYLTRKYTRVTKFIVLGYFAVVALALALVSPEGINSLFGATPKIFEFLQRLSSGDWSFFALSLGIAVAVIVVLLTAIGALAGRTLSMAEDKPSKKPAKVTKAPFTVVRSENMGFLGMTFTIISRHVTATRPIITSIVFAIITTLVLGGTSAILTTLIVLPLAVGLSFGANVFGLYGNSNNWLLSMTQWRQQAIKVFTFTILITIGVTYSIVYAVAAVLGRLELTDFIQGVPSMIAVAMTVTAVSLMFSTMNPLPFTGKVKENIVSSPIVLIGYVAVFIITASIAGNIPLIFREQPVYAWLSSGILVLLAAAIIFFIDYRWKHSEVYATKILTKTISTD